MTSDSPRSASKSPRLALHWQVLIGLALGVGYAWASIQFGWNSFTLNYIQPLGDIFINILKLIAVPLVLFSIIGGVASLGDVKKLGRWGPKPSGFISSPPFRGHPRSGVGQHLSTRHGRQ